MPTEFDRSESLKMDVQPLTTAYSQFVNSAPQSRAPREAEVLFPQQWQQMLQSIYSHLNYDKT